jgi:hypothetical protein
MYDFSKVAPASVGNYLEPGIYKLRVKEASATESTTNKTPGLAVIFENKEGQSVKETFYVTEKSVDRLQYFHTAFLGKELAAKFKNEGEIIAYFVKTLAAAKKVVKTILVGGNISDSGRVFSQLPYSGFVIEEEVELGAFDTDSKEYKKYVTASNMKSEVAGKKNGILNEDPEEEIGAKKKTASTKATTVSKTNKKVKDEEPAEEEEGAEEAEGDGLDW